MGHLTPRDYRHLQRRLDQPAQGAPASETLRRILEVLFTEDEAQAVSLLPINAFTLEEAARLLQKSKDEAKLILDALADKGLLFDFATGATQAYLMAPTMAGFFEFSLMRLDGRFDKRLLSELYYQYINTEEDFLRRIFTLEPSIYRAFVQEAAIEERDRVVVLDYERASQVVNTATCITVGICYCRHKMQHMGQACRNPQEVCLTFNKSAESLSKHGVARQIEKAEARRILDQCIDLGLVQLGDNVQEGVNWICNCCSCCCEALVSYRKLGYNARITTNFVSTYAGEACTACSACVDQCPVNAVTLGKDTRGNDQAIVDGDRCIGCGVCVRFCQAGSLVLTRRKETAFVPKDSFERFILSAAATGKLQNLLCDNYTLLSHDILRRFLGVFLSLPSAKKLLLQRQIRSRYMAALTRTSHYTLFDQLYNKGRKPDYTHPELK
jgi:formate hydrogenlyase subunit 6/NADH:ubiquinone oxidoreductase subunit I